jgi:acyl-CoA thioesterase
VVSDAADLARRCTDAMWTDDAASQGLGMTIDHVAPGQARLSMPIRPDMLNGLGVCHGGFIFSLADSAMAFASNGHGAHAVAQHASVTFIRPGKAGETLTAEAVERSRKGRSGLYDVTVIGSSDGSVIAEFRGHTRLTGGRFFTDAT